jgi:hypothetical protein
MSREVAKAAMKKGTKLSSFSIFAPSRELSPQYGDNRLQKDF